jgi:hypothetical protein
MTSTSDPDPLPADVRAVIELFSTQLAKVRFPDIDAGTLRRQEEACRTEAEVVARAREALAAAESTLARRLEELAGTTDRALAYARIYADADPTRATLAAAIAAIATPSLQPEPAVAPKRRGRPPKRSAELFDAPAHRDDVDAPAPESIAG